MRILHLINSLVVGGAETMVIHLAKEQRRLGHEATICSMYGPGPLDGRALECGIPVIHLDCKPTELSKITKLSDHLKHHRYDLLHSHWEVWLAGAVSGFRHSIPQVHTNHSNHSRRLFLRHRIASRFTSKVAVLSPDVEPYISKWVKVPKQKLAVIPNGIDLSSFYNAVPAEIDAFPMSTPIVGMVARLRAPKDYVTYINSAALLAGPRPDIQFVAVGEGALRTELEKRVADLALNNVHFLGARHDVPRIFRRLSVNVLSSRHEGVPISLLEGMASECPCVGSDIPGIRFALNNGQAGLLVPQGDAEALSQAILELIDNREKRELLIARASQHVRQFSSSQMAQGYLKLYEIASRSGRASGSP